jgi:CHAT domain-containing protein
VQYLARRGLIQMELREGEAANASIREALELTRRIGDRRTEAQVLIDLALVRERVDRDPRQAAVHAAQAVAIARELKMTSLEIPALNQLGSLLRESGQLNEAHAALRDAVIVIARANEHRDEPYVLKNLGQVLIRLGRIDEGERTLRTAAERADAINLTRVRWLARLELAQLHVARNPAQAGQEFEALLAILEEQQSNVLLEGFRAGALDQTLSEYDPYDRYVSFLLDRGETALAFHVAERERARVFLDTLGGVREQLAAAVPAAFRDAEDATLRRISSSQSALRNAGLSDDRRRDLRAAVDADEAALTAMRLRLAADRPALAHARYPKVPHAAELQSTLLAPDEALLSLFLGATRSVAWLVTREHLTTIVLPAREEIEPRIRAALQQLRDPVSRDDRALDALSRALALDCLSDLADGTHLVIVPHGMLYDVPFEALRGGDGRTLLERFAVSYAPSAASLAFFRSLPPLVPGSTTLLALGNPNVHAGPAARTRQADLERVDLLTPLPYTADEMNGIADLFRPRARILSADAATEHSLRESTLDQVRIVHFATHGLIDETHPERSGLVLTASPPDEDGLLQMREIYSLGLQASLVTLSACETALGRHVTGEGIIGLTRAFFYAGARSVVASLWDVEDRSTSRLMQEFYRNIRNGEPIDVALQHAKLAFLKGGGETSRPFYWATFVAIGQARGKVAVAPGRRIPIEQSVFAWAALLAAIAITAASIRRTSGAETSATPGPTHRAP